MNRLGASTSPYLVQHAGNPVDWWEWGEDAFEEARRRDVPILLSVGYAACHWCHVMAHESFEDEATAAYMNEHFVNVKVDREERPDVDAVYMSATTAMTGQGGWPMTVVLTPDGEPFFAGTYFPDKPRHGQPAFTQILQSLSAAWLDRRDEVGKVADDVAAHLRSQAMQSGDEPIDAELLAASVTALAGDFDARNGGFGGAPKFPPSMVLEQLLRHAARVSTSSTTGAGSTTGTSSTTGAGSTTGTGSTTGRQAANLAAATLTAMARGGIYDQLAGGFARYSVDAGWVVPHFEKMLYDNAQLLAVYTHWWRQGGGDLAERIARETADFLLAELRTDQGGFASALDADTDGVEGKFYAWSPAELVEVLGPDDGPWAADLLSVTEAGTFEHGLSTLQLRQVPEDPPRWERLRQTLLAHRAATRTHPARDDKVVAAWNGLAIAALAETGALLEEPRYVDAATAAGRLLAELHLDGDRLLRVSREGVAGRHAGVLEDYACVARGFQVLHSVTGDEAWHDRAAGLLERALAAFPTDDGGFFDTAADAEVLVARPRDPGDNASPSGQSALVHALLHHAALTGSGRHRDAAEAALRQVRVLAERVPRFAGWSLAAAEAAVAGPLEVAVVGSAGDPARSALEAVARRSPSPGLVVVVAEPGAGGVPLLADRPLVDGKPAAYVCRGMVCDRPVTSPEELAVLLH